MNDRTTARSARAGATAPSPGPQVVGAGPETFGARSDAVWAHPVMRLLLRVLSRLRAADRRRPWLLDTAVVVLLAAAAPPDLLVHSPGHPVSRPVGAGLPVGAVLAIAAVLVVPLWWRRRAPAAVFGVCLVVCPVMWSLGLGPAAAAVLLIALFDLALHAAPRAICWALPVTVTGWVLIVVSVIPAASPAAFLILSTGTGIGAVALGLTLRISRLYLSALRDRAARLEVERDQRVRLTAAAERSRIAREMHDIVGHNLSVMVNLADGAAVLTTRDPARTEQALHLIGDTGRQAMDELRRVLGVLRASPDSEDDSSSRSPQPGVRDLDTLLDRVRAAGLPVAYRTVGPVDALGRGVQLTVFRVVQEALTNTLKHVGPGATADVTVAAEDSRLRVRVTDTGSPARERSPSPRRDTGHGLVGIRQRAALYDGTATIGPRDDGQGWIVDVLMDPSASATSGEPPP
ncbi:sensor histidine kinase [Streptomyces sp. N50]|uniref:sensor histidine kinase n=1 Tax=Streptomyces sp. N50 TaxID=3081765 RepID=UPI002962061F|nr:histidine kinase [Streptomyces sp. N50]WOX14464.1 histidine kinase [Streptomyces sp. N50]